MQVTRTYELKLKPNNSQKQRLDNYFYESKCLYNYLLNCSNIFAVHACKVTNIWKLDKDKNKVKVTISYLPAKLRQNIHRNMLSSIKSLKASKQRGRVVGELKFKSEITSLDFDNQSFKIVNNKVKLLGFGKDSIRCLGVRQFENIVKFRNARLLKKPSGYYLKVCVIKEISEHQVIESNVGIDMGITDNIILSTGEKLNCKLKEPVRLKKLSRKYNKMLYMNGKRTNNSQKVLLQLNREYEKISNRKADFANKLLHYLDMFDHVAFQDEQLAGWKNLRGNRRTIQHSCLGIIKQKLKSKVIEEPEGYICLDKWLPTTKWCPSCGTVNNITLDDRVYKCDCGYIADRDIHSAKNMLKFANLA